MRIFQVTIRRGKEEGSGRFLQGTAIPLMRGAKGIVRVPPGPPRADTRRELGFVVVRESVDAPKTFIGERYKSPRIDPVEAGLVESRTIKPFGLGEN